MSTLETYRYSAFDEDGDKVNGTEKATSASAAHLALLQRGLQPIDVKEHKSILKFEITKKTVSRKEIMHFSRQLSVFVEAGIPIMEALEVISEETTDKLLKKVLLDMIDQLQAGDTFASAAAVPSRGLSPLLRRRPRVGRAHRNARQSPPDSPSISSETSTLGRRSSPRSSIRRRGMSGRRHGRRPGDFVLPKFKTFFDSLNAKLPLPTRMLLSSPASSARGGGRSLGHPDRGRRRLRRDASVNQGAGELDAVLLKLPVAGALSKRRSSSVSAESLHLWSPPGSTCPGRSPSPPNPPTTPCTARASTTSASR